MAIDIEKFKNAIYKRSTSDHYASLIKIIQGTRTFNGFKDIMSFSGDLAGRLAKDIFEGLTAYHFQEAEDLASRLGADFNKEALIHNLRPSGHEVKRLVSERIFADLGCGRPDKSFFPRFMAQVFNATHYIGVDSEGVEDEVRTDEFATLGKFSAYFLKSDILSFLSKVEFEKTVFFISGLDPRWTDIQFGKISEKDTFEYLDCCMAEMTRICGSGDGIILGPATVDFPLYKHGFRVMAQLPRMEGSMLSGPADYNFLTVYVKA